MNYSQRGKSVAYWFLGTADRFQTIAISPGWSIPPNSPIVQSSRCFRKSLRTQRCQRWDLNAALGTVKSALHQSSTKKKALLSKKEYEGKIGVWHPTPTRVTGTELWSTMMVGVLWFGGVLLLLGHHKVNYGLYIKICKKAACGLL